MGHYWSEMQDDMPDKPVERVLRKPVDEKEREVTGVPSPVDEAVETQYAIDYDRSKGWRKPDEPETANLYPLREVMNPLYTAHRDEEESTRKFLREVASNRKHGKRPAVTMKRTVTYGPWEILDTVEKEAEGWY